MVKTKQRNPADATFRNERARVKQIAALAEKVATLEADIADLKALVARPHEELRACKGGVGAE